MSEDETFLEELIAKLGNYENLIEPYDLYLKYLFNRHETQCTTLDSRFTELSRSAVYFQLNMAMSQSLEMLEVEIQLAWECRQRIRVWIDKRALRRTEALKSLRDAYQETLDLV